MWAVHVMYAAVAAAALLNGTGIVAAYAQPIQTDANVGVADSFEAPDGAHTIAIHDISGRTYALVAGDSHLQIMDITNLADPVPVSSVYRDDGSVWMWGGLRNVATHDISGRTYALLGGTVNTIVVDITIPDSPAWVSSLSYDVHGNAWMEGSDGIAIYDISGRTYAVVASFMSVHVVDITHPADPLYVDVIYTDGRELVNDIAVHESAGRMYALVASWIYAGDCFYICAEYGRVNVIDITRPAESFTVATIPFDVLDIEFTRWGGSLAVHHMSNRTYAIVENDSGQVGYGMIYILDITQPGTPVTVSAITGNADDFAKMGVASDIVVHDISNRTYAVMASWADSGVQIIDITSPDKPVLAAVISDDADGFTELNGASSVAIHDTPNGTYALVASWYDSGIQIIDITNPPEISIAHAPSATNALVATEIAYLSGGTRDRDVVIYDMANRTYALVTDYNGVEIWDVTHPSDPRSASKIRNDGNGLLERFNPTDIAVRDMPNGTYAFAASLHDSAVHIIDVTQPESPLPVAAVIDDADGFAELGEVYDIAVHDISNKTYAFVVSLRNSSMYIMDVTQPESPLPVAAVTDDADGFAEMRGASAVTIHDMSNRTYAFVASRYDDGVQTIDITNPANPIPVADVTDDADGFAELDGAVDVAIRDISNRTYAFVASRYDDGVQTIDITNPANPIPVADVTDDADGFTTLNWAHDIAIHDISNRTYAFVASWYGSGLQIIDVTHPDSPLPAGQLAGGRTVAVHDISDRTYTFVVNDVGTVVITEVAGAEPAPWLPIVGGSEGFADACISTGAGLARAATLLWTGRTLDMCPPA